MSTAIHFAASLESSENASRTTSWKYFSVLPAAGLFWSLYWQRHSSAAPAFSTWCGFILAGTLLASTVTDLLRHKIPNYMTYPAVGWLLSLGVLQFSLQTVGTITASDGHTQLLSPGAIRWTALIAAPALSDQLVGAGVCFCVMFFIFMCAGGGGGDVKIATVIGAALGLVGGLTAVVAAHIAAGTFALVWAVVRFGPLHVARSIGRKVGFFLMPLWIDAPSREEHRLLAMPIPLSPFFLLGVCYAVLSAA